MSILQILVIIFIQQHTVNKSPCTAVSATDVQYKDVRVKGKPVIDLPEIKAMSFMQARVMGMSPGVFLLCLTKESCAFMALCVFSYNLKRVVRKHPSDAINADLQAMKNFTCSFLQNGKFC